MSDLTREKFVNTKWDVRGWSNEQKTQWQETMFELGITWGCGGKVVDYLDKSFYYVKTCEELRYGYDEACFKYHVEKEMKWEDIFPVSDKPVEETSTDDVLIVTKEEPLEEKGTSWTDSHYDNYYTLTEEDIEEGKLRIDAYFVNRMWKLNSFDDTGCAFHSLKTYARMANNKNTLERELNALNGQLKRWAKLSGVKLES